MNFACRPDGRSAPGTGQGRRKPEKTGFMANCGRRNRATTKAAAFGALFLAICIWTIRSADAAFVLELDDGSGPVFVTDGGVGDTSGTTGIITFNGTVGSFNISVTTGVSKPEIGTPNQAKLDLNSLQISGGGPGTLSIRLTDTDFTQTGVDVATSLAAGVTGGSVAVSTYIDRSNAEFGTGEVLTDFGVFGPGSFSAGDTVSLAPPVNPSGAAPFSMTLAVTVIHTADWQITTFDAGIMTDLVVDDIPAPASILALLPGLLGLGYLRRRRARP